MNPTISKMIARLQAEAAGYGKGSAYADLLAICSGCDAQRLQALDERNTAREENEALLAELEALREVEKWARWVFAVDSTNNPPLTDALAALDKLREEKP